MADKIAIFRERIERYIDDLYLKGGFKNEQTNSARLVVEGYPLGVDIVGEQVVLDRNSEYATTYEPDDEKMVRLAMRRINDFLM